jgi:hypothetical protein
LDLGSFRGGAALGAFGGCCLRSVFHLLVGEDQWFDFELEQLPWFQAQGFRDLDEGGELKLWLTTGFDSLVVLVFESRTLGKRLLAEALCLSECSYAHQQARRVVVCHIEA